MKHWIKSIYILVFPKILSIFIISSIVFIHSQAQIIDSNPGTLWIASCQFPVSADISENFQWIKKQMIEAKSKNTDIVHFPECALSGYPGTDMKTIENFNWNELHLAMDSVLHLAKVLKMHVLLGSMHKLSGDHKPHNSLYLINPGGEIVDRYDKRFCTTSDLEYFSPGDHFVTFELNGIRCGLLICFDVRFPELYREYRKLGAELIFQSFYNAREEKGNIHPEIMPLTARAMAASNYFYMSLTNSSAPESWPCYMVTPDGLVQGKLDENVPGILFSEIDISRKFYDASGPFRQGAMNGKLNSGECETDSMSTNRKSY
jgi:predicted amidohydrolase